MEHFGNIYQPTTLTTVSRNLLIIILCSIIYTSCAIIKHSNACVLDYETNSITGTDNLDTLYDIPQLYIPRILETIYFDSDEIHNAHFSRNASEEFVGVHISGCKDTIAAKERMAFHLMEKYKVLRYDSTFLRTIYSAEVVDESKLIHSKPNCEKLISLGNNEDGIIINKFTCLSWKSLNHLLIPLELNHETNSVEFESREGTYDLSVPDHMITEFGFETYQKYILENLGIQMHKIRIDTVDLGVYKYKL